MTPCLHLFEFEDNQPSHVRKRAIIRWSGFQNHGFLLRSLGRDPLRVPIKTALIAVDEVARFLEAVELAGIDYEFGGNIEAAQGLIHLFAVEQWDVEIVPAAHK